MEETFLDLSLPLTAPQVDIFFQMIIKYTYSQGNPFDACIPTARGYPWIEGNAQHIDLKAPSFTGFALLCLKIISLFSTFAVYLSLF